MRIHFLFRTLNILKYLAIYYLSAKMICFAIPKFLHMQFRILNWQSYVPLVELSKYEHMWSFFGRSYNYNLFIGLIEFLIGVLIVFSRTRLIALLISLAACTNILILNIEFEIIFALQHIILDLTLTILLLSFYYKDLFKFFLKMGGKFHQAKINNRNKFQIWFPYFFVIILSLSYFIFAKDLKSTVNDEITGAYRIRSLEINKTIIELGEGVLADEPMLFLEHNFQVVLSMRDTLYKGRYTWEKDSIKLYFFPSDLKLRSIQGIISNTSITGKNSEGDSFRIHYERIEGEKNYLNRVYQ